MDVRVESARKLANILDTQREDTNGKHLDDQRPPLQVEIFGPSSILYPFFAAHTNSGGTPMMLCQDWAMKETERLPFCEVWLYAKPALRATVACKTGRPSCTAAGTFTSLLARVPSNISNPARLWFARNAINTSIKTNIFHTSVWSLGTDSVRGLFQYNNFAIMSSAANMSNVAVMIQGYKIHLLWKTTSSAMQIEQELGGISFQEGQNLSWVWDDKATVMWALPLRSILNSSSLLL
jgi:hypothetical protein